VAGDDIWSLPALKHHYDQLFENERRYLREVIERIDARHDQFDRQAQRLQAASNEWRGALNDRDRNSVSRVEFDTRIDALENKTDASNATQSALLAALSNEVREGFGKIRAETASQFEQLRIRNAEEAGAKQSLINTRVWALALLSAISTVVAVVAMIYAITN